MKYSVWYSGASPNIPKKTITTFTDSPYRAAIIWAESIDQEIDYIIAKGACLPISVCDAGKKVFQFQISKKYQADLELIKWEEK
jgi:hypothetical protein